MYYTVVRLMELIGPHTKQSPGQFCSYVQWRRGKHCMQWGVGTCSETVTVMEKNVTVCIITLHQI